MNIAMDAPAITRVAAQPRTSSGARSVKRPMISGLWVTIINAAMIGAAATPLKTALKNSAFIGFSPDQSRPTPINVAATIIA